MFYLLLLLSSSILPSLSCTILSDRSTTTISLSLVDYYNVCYVLKSNSSSLGSGGYWNLTVVAQSHGILDIYDYEINSNRLLYTSTGNNNSISFYSFTSVMYLVYQNGPNFNGGILDFKTEFINNTLNFNMNDCPIYTDDIIIGLSKTFTCAILSTPSYGYNWIVRFNNFNLILNETFNIRNKYNQYILKDVKTYPLQPIIYNDYLLLYYDYINTTALGSNIDIEIILASENCMMIYGSGIFSLRPMDYTCWTFSSPPVGYNWVVNTSSLVLLDNDALTSDIGMICLVSGNCTFKSDSQFTITYSIGNNFTTDYLPYQISTFTIYLNYINCQSVAANTVITLATSINQCALVSTPNLNYVWNFFFSNFVMGSSNDQFEMVDSDGNILVKSNGTVPFTLNYASSLYINYLFAVGNTLQPNIVINAFQTNSNCLSITGQISFIVRPFDYTCWIFSTPPTGYSWFIYVSTITFSNGDYIIDDKNNKCSVTGYCEFDSFGSFSLTYYFGNYQTVSYTDTVSFNAELVSIPNNNSPSSINGGIIAAAVICSILGLFVLVYVGYYYYNNYYKKDKITIDDSYINIYDI